MSASSPQAAKNASQSLRGTLEVVLAAGGVGQHAVHVEHDGGPRRDRPVPPPVQFSGTSTSGTG